LYIDQKPASREFFGELPGEVLPSPGIRKSLSTEQNTPGQRLSCYRRERGHVIIEGHMDTDEIYRRFYSFFRDISGLVHSCTRVDEILEVVVWKSSIELQAKGAVVSIIDTKTNHVDLFASHGMEEKYLSKGPLSRKGVIKDLCRLNKAVVIEDLAADPRVDFPQELMEEGVVMLLDIPLNLRDDLIGMIRLFFTERRSFTPEELDFVVAVAEQFSCALDKARLIEEKQSQYDQLAMQTEKLSALGRMAAGIAHEINNPLAGILLFSSNTLKKAPEEGPIRQALEVIIREAQRCKNIIQDLLEFSRDRQPEKVMAGVNTAIEKVLSILENEIRLRHISVEKNLAPGLPEIPLDLNLMQQVFVNLFMNAIEAIGQDGVLTIQSRTSPDGRKQRIEVSDTGCGIPEENLAHIFEPFFSTKSNGTGLGLAVTYGIIQKHDGNIQVFSKVGQGTRFLIEIPNQGR
jgi:two-component system NtrC family sensor kinase